MADRRADIDALNLIRAVVNEFKLGTKHYDENGRRLMTVRSVLNTLIDGKNMKIEPVPSRRDLFPEIVKQYGRARANR